MLRTGARPRRSEWTLDSQREHFMVLISELDRRNVQQFEAQEKAVVAALAAAKEAVLKAEGAYEKRFEAVNEFRAVLTDQTATFATRNEVDQRTGTNADKIDALATRLDRLEGRSSGLNAGWIILGQIIAVIAAVSAISVVIAR